MSEKERILVFSTQHMPTGGIESHLLEFCTRIATSGVEIDLVVTNSEMTAQTEAVYRRMCRKVFLGKAQGSLQRLLWLTSVGVRVSTTRYQALYTNGQGESVAIFSRLVHLAGPWVHHHHTAGDASDRATWGERYLQVMRSADEVIACSETNASALQNALGRRIQSIPCFSRDISGGPLMKSSHVRLGYYGRLIPEKGIEILCRLSNEPEFAGHEIHIWGEGAAFPETFFHRFPRVQFHGPFFGKEALVEIAAQIDAYLLISTHPEGLPIALLEVMSAGVPWLATDKGGIPDIACDPVSTRVISADSAYEETKRAVLELISDIHSGNVDRAVQKQLYADRFSFPVLVKRWREVFELNPVADSDPFVAQGR